MARTTSLLKIIAHHHFFQLEGGILW